MNAAEHCIISALTLAAAATALRADGEEAVPHAAVGRLGGYCFATLPDLIEPATSPHHRQFFHSVAVGSALAYGLYRLYRWQPDAAEQRFWRFLGLAAGGAYLVHLALDATTKRSLPWVGRFD